MTILYCLYYCKYLCSFNIAAAVIMFLANMISMNVFSFLSDAAASTGLVSMIIKKICAVVGAISFVTFVFMSILEAIVVQ